MPSSGYESTDLLDLFNQYAARPTTDAITSVAKYARLSRAQNRVIALMQGVAPWALYPKVGYGSLPTLTTTDQQVFTFGTDSNGYPIFPMGKGGIYANLQDIPDNPWIEGRDFMREGTQIRIPNDGTYGGTLYWYGIAQPADITATVQPSLFPEASRELIVVEAVRSFAGEGTRNTALRDEMKDEWASQWPVWCLVWRVQYRSGGAVCWWNTGLQLALQNQWGGA